MYPYIRTFLKLRKSKNKPKLAHPTQECVMSFKVRIGDIDPFWEMNNGRYLTIMDLGRYDLGLRVGLFQILDKHKWSIMVAAVSSRYRHRLKLGQAYQLHTRMIYVDERWFYFNQQFKTKEKVHVSALVRTAVFGKDGLVPTADVLRELPFSDDEFASLRVKPEWISEWEKSETIHKSIMENGL